MSRRPPSPWPHLHVDAPAGVPDVTGLRRSAILHDDGQLYLERFEVVVTPSMTVRLHHWCASDDQRAPHDHPWDNMTTVLAGQLVEHADGPPRPLAPGAIVTRQAAHPHRVELVSDDAWTLFVCGPIVRHWGFHTGAGWVHWRNWPYAGRYEDDDR